jgi:nanoRNase/pAp phosphatase (c-di-AMP/oligoRNAs hydrolase)
LKLKFTKKLSIYFVKDDVFEVPDGVTSVVEHRPEDLGGHDQASGSRIDLDVAGHQTNVVKAILNYDKENIYF